jgi:CheY-like chemotaxis protein
MAESAKSVFEEMSDTKVVELVAKREQRLLDRYALALVTSYHDDSRDFTGQFTLGFQEEINAVLLASAISEKRGLPQVSELHNQAMDILAEFMQKVVSATTERWQSLGVKVTAQAPKPLLDVGLHTHKKLHTEAFVIILNLSMGWLVFNVTFEQAKDSLEDKRILVLDDSVVIRGLLTRTLGEMGCHVAQAKTADQALKAASSFAPDLVISDMVTLTGTGLASMETLKDIYPRAKFIFLGSKQAQEYFKHNMESLEVAGWLTTPVRVDRFLDMVKKTLNPNYQE